MTDDTPDTEISQSEAKTLASKDEIYGPQRPEDGEARVRPEIQPEPQNAGSDNPPKKHLKAKKVFKLIFWIGLALFLILHIYLLALRFLPAPLTLNMMMNSDPLQRESVTLKSISPHLISAVIAAEDTRFCQHNGIDFEALEKAIEDNQKSTRRRGGSTISQQTAKNIIFWNGGGYLRKAGEAYVTLVVEFIWPKDKIMEHYLNIADWGDGIYGAETAAKVRFGKSAADLSKREAALLASVLPSPYKWRVDPPGDYVQKRVGTVQARMAVVKSDQLDRCAQP